ncbi:MAG TPA: glycosyltransferase family 4 protein [Candidatus Nanoarchaeia archaeon]|nr:glycosyltransferase family 4 protein [Candidatus Nanoarchaeia archaeon]
MNIALLMRKTDVQKEATHITINAFAEELKKKHNVFIVRGRSITDYRSEFKKIKERIDIIHAFAAAPLLAMNAIAVKRLQPSAKTVFSLKSYSRHPLGSLWFSPILNTINAVTVPTNVYAEKIKHHGLKNKKIHIIRSSIDTEYFVPKKEVKKKNHKIVLYYGSLFSSKGVDYLIAASEQIRQAHPEALIVIAPREGSNKELEQKVKDKKNIKIVPEINVLDYVNLADIVVLPYTDLTATEGNPSCMLEAVACKTAVITTDLPELQEIFTYDEVMKVRPRNSAALAEAINSLLSDGKKRKQMTENAYRKIKEFDIRKITKEFEGLYENITTHPK